MKQLYLKYDANTTFLSNISTKKAAFLIIQPLII